MPVADEGQATVAMLDEVRITPELAGRPVRDRDFFAEAQALTGVAETDRYDRHALPG